ncbi:MAG: hypothetical protein QNK30_05245 [Bacteroidales bacterium]|nr:hypothetical protein [Bacteroidales bacterium]
MMENKKDNLENFVSSNRGKFDFLDPDPRIWEQINKSKKTIRMRGMLWKVAAILIVLMIYPFYNLVLNKQSNFTIAPSSGNNVVQKIPELQEADAYYTSYINDQMQQMQVVLEDEPDMMTELEKDMQNLENIYNDLLEDLNDNIDNKEVVEALIQNYRMKVKILEELLNYISTEDTKEPAQNEL